MTKSEQLTARQNLTVAQSTEPARASRVPALRPAMQPSVPKLRLWLWGILGISGLALAFVASSQLWMARAPAVSVEIAAFSPITRVLAVNGRIAAVSSVELRAAGTGRLIALPVVEGDLVEADQVLAQVDAKAQNAAVRQAMAGLDAALVAQQQALATYERDAALGANVAKTVLESDTRAVQSAAQDVARMSAALDQAQALLESYTIRAPILGSILALDAEVGQLVGPSTPLLTLADLSELVVEADVDEAYATQIVRNQPAVLQLAGDIGTREGHVTFVSARVDEATGGLAIKIAFHAPVTAPIGLTVATNIIVDQRSAALTVPRTAMLTNTGELGVLVVTDGLAQFQPLTVLDWPAARLIVTAGLTVGDVVIADATGIAAGQAVLVDQP